MVEWQGDPERLHPEISSASRLVRAAQDFFDEMCKCRSVFESISPLIANDGSPVTKIKEFACCLAKARCHTIWIKGYRQKMGITTRP